MTEERNDLEQELSVQEAPAEKKRFSLKGNKKWRRALLIAAIAAAVCGAAWGGLTLARNAQRGDVNVYAVEYFSMTNYWGDSGNTGGQVTTDKLQKVYLSSSQTVSRIAVSEGDTVQKGAVLLAYDSTLTNAQVEKAKIAYDRAEEDLKTAQSELELLKKAKNRELLEAELNGLKKELDDEIAKLDRDAGYDPSAALQPGLAKTMDAGDGNSKGKPIYYYWLSTSPLNDTALKGILTDLKRATPTAETTKIETYLVLVYRDGDKQGGAATSRGLLLTETYVPASAAEGETPAVPASTTLGFQFCDLPEFEDPGRTYDSDKYKELSKKIAQAQELLDASMTKLELAEATTEKAQEIKELETAVKVKKLDWEKKRSELGDGNVYAEFAGTVKVVRDPDEAYNTGEAVVELSGGGGYYITATLSESDLGSVQVGDTVQIDSWMTGTSCEGTIVSIDDYPTNDYSNWGEGSTNVSYYPFKVFVTEDQDLQPNTWVDIQYQKTADTDGDTLYLESLFLRSENGKSYVMVQGADGKLEKRWVQTGRDLWGSYTQIRGGLTVDDYVAFPYGRDVVEGANTRVAEAQELYSSGT